MLGDRELPKSVPEEFMGHRNDLSIVWLIAGGVFLACYLAGVWILDYFQLDSLSYVLNQDLVRLTGSDSKSHLLFFDRQQLSSALWKIIFLLPSLLCASVWICRHIGFADRIHSLVARSLEARWCLPGAIGVAFSAIAILIVFVTHGKLLVDDEMAYVFQAQTYLSGHIAMPPPPAASSLSNFHFLTYPVWAGKYLFGHPAFLAIGLALGSPYLASVAMSLASLVLLYILGIRTGTRYQAAIATWLVAVSPWFLFMSTTLLSHVSTLFLFLVAAIGWTSLEKAPRSVIGLGIGLCMGWLFATRPFTAVLLCIPIGFLGVKYAIKDPNGWTKVLAAMAVGGMSIVVLVLLYNLAVTGDAFEMPVTLNCPGESLGFKEFVPVGSSVPIRHTPIMGLMNLAVNVVRMNSWFLGWPISFLPLLGLLAISGVGKETEAEDRGPLEWTHWDSLWVAFIVVLCLGYFFYHHPGVSDTGPVYYYELLVPLSLLSAKGILRCHRMLGVSGLKSLRHLVPVFCVVSVIGSFVFFVPEKAFHNMKLREQAYHPFEMAEKSIKGKAIVFVGRRPIIGWLFNNPQASPQLDDRILFVRLLDDQSNNAAMGEFPDRSPYRLIYDREAHRFRLEPYRQQ